MKTLNNVHKSILKLTSVLIALVLTSISLNAQGFLTAIADNSISNDMTTVIIGTATEMENSSNTGLTLSKTNNQYTEDFENPMELEEWMINETFFNANTQSTELELEESLELENWMTNENYFNTTNTILETESDLDLEDWMLNSSYFDTEVADEEKLELEPWLTSDKHWNN